MIDCRVVSISMYEPLTSVAESRAAMTMGIKCEAINDEGKRRLNDNHFGIWFMPHCARSLSQAVVWGNWGPSLNRLHIICNSFGTSLSLSLSLSRSYINDNE
jgi:hypothetical protein